MATFISHSPEETIAFARRSARDLRPNDVVALSGDLGSGKTQFVKGLVAGLDSHDKVTSPTFTLIHEYRGRLPIFHFDFYRLNHEAEIERIGFHDYLNEDGVAVVEWADRFPGLLPDRARWFRLEAQNGNERRIVEEGK